MFNSHVTPEEPKYLDLDGVNFPAILAGAEALAHAGRLFAKFSPTQFSTGGKFDTDITMSLAGELLDFMLLVEANGIGPASWQSLGGTAAKHDAAHAWMILRLRSAVRKARDGYFNYSTLKTAQTTSRKTPGSVCRANALPTN